MKSSAWLTPIGTSLGGKIVETSDLWERFGPIRPDIPEKVGFKSLFSLASDEDIVGLASRAVPMSTRAFLRANCDKLIAVSSSFDSVTPGLASSLHDELKLSRQCSILSLNDACTGFVKGLEMAMSLVSVGASKLALVILADGYSSYYLEEDIAVSTLFSDGASAFVVSKNRLSDFPGGQSIKIVARGRSSHTAGHLRNILEISAGQDQQGSPPSLRMSGPAVYGFVVAQVSEVWSDLLDGRSEDYQKSIQWYVHQGSALVVEAVATTLNREATDLFRARHYGNVVSSSIPFQLFEDWDSLQPGAILGFLGFGVGMAIEGAIYECVAR